MPVAPRRAYALARVRAHAARLRRAATVAGRPVCAIPAAPLDRDAVRAEFLALCGTVVGALPELAAVTIHLVHRRLVGNVSLALSSIVRHRHRDEWLALWEDLGVFGTSLPADAVVDFRSIAALADRLDRTPLAWAATELRHSAADDPGAAMLAVERAWAVRLSGLASDLPRGEQQARELLQLLLVERDLAWLQRAPAVARVDVETAMRATVLLSQTWSRAQIETAMRSGQWDELIAGTRRARRRACVRALMGAPFALSVPLAVILLKAEELRVAALDQPDDVPADAYRRALAGSLLET